MRSPRKLRSWPNRTAHIAPFDHWTPEDERYVAHVEGVRSIVDRADGPFERLEDAVAWARERAPVVLVVIKGEGFRRSAGERPFAVEPDLPLWPPLSE